MCVGSERDLPEVLDYRIFSPIYIKSTVSLWIAVVQWLKSGTPTRTIRVQFPSDWLLHHGDNRGRHSANHNLLPDMHLRVPVLRVKTCRDSRLV